MAVGFAQTEEFLHVTFKIHSLCPKTTKSVNPVEIGIGLGRTEEFFHVIRKIPYLCLENDRVRESRKKWTLFLGRLRNFFT